MSTNTQFVQPLPSRAVPAPDIDTEGAWQQLLARDRSGAFFYAVTTTGVFCRPDCKSRRPLRSNVRFYATVEAARAAGFRPCKRCKPAARGRTLDEIRGHIEDGAVAHVQVGLKVGFRLED